MFQLKVISIVTQHVDEWIFYPQISGGTQKCFRVASPGNTLVNFSVFPHRKWFLFKSGGALSKKKGVRSKITCNTYICSGAKKVIGKSLWCHTINSRLDDGLKDALPSPYKKQHVVCHSGAHVGPKVASPLHGNLAVNWSLGDKDIEVLDSSTGLIVPG